VNIKLLVKYDLAHKVVQPMRVSHTKKGDTQRSVVNQWRMPSVEKYFDGAGVPLHGRDESIMQTVRYQTSLRISHSSLTLAKVSKVTLISLVPPAICLGNARLEPLID